jgi:hypothetical protein
VIIHKEEARIGATVPNFIPPGMALGQYVTAVVISAGHRNIFVGSVFRGLIFTRHADRAD